MMALMILRWTLAALMGWMAMAHLVAFGRTKRMLYALMGLTGLALIGAIWLVAALTEGSGLAFLPLLGALTYLFLQISAAPSAEYREYAAPRDVLLLRRPLREPLPDERLAAASPVQAPPPPRQILIMTVVMLAGIALLASVL